VKSRVKRSVVDQCYLGFFDSNEYLIWRQNSVTTSISVATDRRFSSRNICCNSKFWTSKISAQHINRRSVRHCQTSDSRPSVIDNTWQRQRTRSGGHVLKLTADHYTKRPATSFCRGWRRWFYVPTWHRHVPIKWAAVYENAYIHSTYIQIYIAPKIVQWIWGAGTRWL